MKNLLALLLSVACALCLTGCAGNPYNRADAPTHEPIEAGSAHAPTETPQGGQDTQADGDSLPTLRIRVGDREFQVSLLDGEATRALLERLPFTIAMNELNGNEKYHDCSDALPTASERVENIRAGDLMLYGDDCLVLFYKSFPTSYSYTRLGFMDNAAGLAEALGAGQAQVTFEIDD